MPPVEISYCHCHFVKEPILDDVYRICFECGHVWNTAQELLDAYNAEGYYFQNWQRENLEEEWLDGVRIITDPDQIAFCVECIHDW